MSQINLFTKETIIGHIIYKIPPNLPHGDRGQRDGLLL